MELTANPDPCQPWLFAVLRASSLAANSAYRLAKLGVSQSRVEIAIQTVHSTLLLTI